MSSLRGATDPGAVRIGAALPLGSENRWSDMLAVLADTDSGPLLKVLKLDLDPFTVRARREVAASRLDRPDMVLDVGGKAIAVLEMKVLSGLGTRQLERYAESTPGAKAYAVVHPRHLPLGLKPQEPWRTLAWEDVLEAYAAGTHPWAAETATAWLAHVATAMPSLGVATVWGDLRAGEDFVLELRARASWLFEQLSARVQGLDVDLVASTAGVSWVTRMIAPTPVPGYAVVAEIEENLPVRDFPKMVNHDGLGPRGPAAKVLLRRSGIFSSEGYDWSHLAALWPVMAASPFSWVPNAASPRTEHDRHAWQAAVAAGLPKHVGIGFGHKQAQRYGDTMFGARVQYPRTMTLGELVDEAELLANLVKELAAVMPQPASTPEAKSGRT